VRLGRIGGTRSVQRARPSDRGLPALAAVILVVAACAGGPSTPPSVSPAPTPLASVDATGFTAATCTANSELTLWFGSPDAGVTSDAWRAFEAAAQAKDPMQLDAAATVVLGHLEAARVAAARGARWPTGAPANTEFLTVVSGLETYIRTVKAAHGDPAVTAQAAKDREGAWPHYLAYLQMLQAMIVAKSIPLTQLPC
jgi:hypothetical protein